jgi:desulfoferrodoxin (superoxide reductase-like protein)
MLGKPKEKPMPIIKAKQKQEKEQIRISVDKSVIENIRQYCEWASISKQDEFFEQAAEFVLSKDKDWLALKNNSVEKIIE